MITRLSKTMLTCLLLLLSCNTEEPELRYSSLCETTVDVFNNQTSIHVFSGTLYNWMNSNDREQFTEYIILHTFLNNPDLPITEIVEYTGN